MKRISLFFGIWMVLTACSSPQGADLMTLSGTIKGLKKGTVYLEREGDSTLLRIDSVAIDGNETFAFEVPLEEPEILFLRLKLNTGAPINERFRFFGEAGTIELKTSLKNFGNDVQISGSTNQEKLEAYQQLVKRFSDRNLDLIREQLEAGQLGNDSLLAAKREAQQRVLAGKYLATVNFAVNEKEFEIAPYLMLSEVFDANVKYLDTVYKSLPEGIRNSRYGIQLDQLIRERKAAEGL